MFINLHGTLDAVQKSFKMTPIGWSIPLLRALLKGGQSNPDLNFKAFSIDYRIVPGLLRSARNDGDEDVLLVLNHPDKEVDGAEKIFDVKTKPDILLSTPHMGD